MDGDRLGEHVGRHGRGALGDGLIARGRNDRAGSVVRDWSRTAVFGQGVPRGLCPATQVSPTHRLWLSCQASFVARMVQAGPRTPVTDADAGRHEHQQSKHGG